MLEPELLWNIFLTFVLAPVAFIVRNLMNELKRIDILVNKTREEIAKDFLSKSEFEKDFQRVLDAIGRIDNKLDRLTFKE
jgi:hypothetical protein